MRTFVSLALLGTALLTFSAPASATSISPRWLCDFTMPPPDPGEHNPLGEKTCEFIIPLGAGGDAGSEDHTLTEAPSWNGSFVDTIDVRHPTHLGNSGAHASHALVWFATFRLGTPSRPRSEPIHLDLHLIEVSGGWRVLALLDAGSDGALQGSLLSPVMTTVPNAKIQPFVAATVSIEPPPPSAGAFGQTVVELTLDLSGEQHSTVASFILDGDYRLVHRTLGLIDEIDTPSATLTLNFNRISYD